MKIEKDSGIHPLSFWGEVVCLLFGSNVELPLVSAIP